MLAKVSQVYASSPRAKGAKAKVMAIRMLNIVFYLVYGLILSMNMVFLK